jgi:chemotaxis protein methyltransferase CheR
LPFGVRSDGLDTPPSPLTLPSEERAESKEEAEAPPAPAADLKRARALADRGDLDKARELCEAALARDRLDPEAHLLLAAICQEQGEIPAALEALRRAIYLAPDCASAHFLMGSLLLQQGDPRRGQRYMETVVRLMSPIPRDEPVPGSDGLTAGRLLETARAYLESPS